MGCGGTGVCICQSEQTALKMSTFNAEKLYINKKDQ